MGVASRYRDSRMPDSPRTRCPEASAREAGVQAGQRLPQNEWPCARARSATSETKHSERQIRLVSYHVLPGHLQVGDRFSDETGEWEVTSQPHSIAGSESVNASVRRVDQPSTPEDRTWVAHERIRVRAPHRSLSA